ncbi:hypothetical protein EB796_004908 [Bugula neritina]|uniref:Uncharacterized protein n=1 Tax=Bugula neritina TaxID=10212 RepID=A0A7J7KFX6_BUGNE|nr:hypothetical protein EB796_012666 [Bugula neritina]KAF6036791.1 hypothetical protein EB796_004908 [Bugula neritina]
MCTSGKKGYDGVTKPAVLTDQSLLYIQINFNSYQYTVYNTQHTGCHIHRVHSLCFSNNINYEADTFELKACI